MLVIKAIFKVIGQVVGGVLLSAGVLVAFVAGCFGISAICKWISDGLSSLVGIEVLAAFAAGAAVVLKWLVFIVFIGAIVVMFGVCIYDEYWKLRRAEERKAELR